MLSLGVNQKSVELVWCISKKMLYSFSHKLMMTSQIENNTAATIVYLTITATSVVYSGVE